MFSHKLRFSNIRTGQERQIDGVICLILGWLGLSQDTCEQSLPKGCQHVPEGSAGAPRESAFIHSLFYSHIQQQLLGTPSVQAACWLRSYPASNNKHVPCLQGGSTRQADSCPLKIHMLTSQPPVPENVTDLETGSL